MKQSPHVARVLDELARIEAAERELLESLSYPTDLDRLFELVAPEGPKNNQRRRDRGRHAMYSLLHCRNVRSWLAEFHGMEKERVSRALWDALLLGRHSLAVLLNADLGEAHRSGTRRGGQAPRRRVADRHAEWQAIADTLPERLNRSAAAQRVLIHLELSRRGRRRLPHVKTIARSIDWPPKRGSVK